MCLNLKKEQELIVSLRAGGSSAQPQFQQKPLAVRILNVIFDFSPRSILRTHQ
jgi:hypothetical protein